MCLCLWQSLSHDTSWVGDHRGSSNTPRRPFPIHHAPDSSARTCGWGVCVSPCPMPSPTPHSNPPPHAAGSSVKTCGWARTPRRVARSRARSRSRSRRARWWLCCSRCGRRRCRARAAPRVAAPRARLAPPPFPQGLHARHPARLEATQPCNPCIPASRPPDICRGSDCSDRSKPRTHRAGQRLHPRARRGAAVCAGDNGAAGAGRRARGDLTGALALSRPRRLHARCSRAAQEA